MGVILVPIVFLFSISGNADLGLEIYCILGVFAIVLYIKRNFLRSVYVIITFGLILIIELFLAIFFVCQNKIFLESWRFHLLLLMHAYCYWLLV